MYEERLASRRAEVSRFVAHERIISLFRLVAFMLIVVLMAIGAIDGAQFLNEHHPFALELDLFGRGSLKAVRQRSPCRLDFFPDLYNISLEIHLIEGRDPGNEKVWAQILAELNLSRWKQ